ncbi:MAG: hypothetical protein AAFR60_09050, partial [Pseudomonadota bacterium]
AKLAAKNLIVISKGQANPVALATTVAREAVFAADRINRAMVQRDFGEREKRRLLSRQSWRALPGWRVLWK